MEIILPFFQNWNVSGLVGILWPQDCQCQHIQHIALATQVVQRRNTPDFTKTLSKEAVVRIGGLLRLKKRQCGITQLVCLRIAKVITSKTADNGKIGLAICIAHTGVAAYAQQPALGRNAAFHQLPQFLDMPICLLRRLLAKKLAIIVQNGNVQQANHHVSRVQIAMVVQGKIVRVVCADFSCIFITRRAYSVHQQDLSTLHVFRCMGRVWIHQCRPHQNRAVPNV